MTPVGLAALAMFLDTMSIDRAEPARAAIRSAAGELQGASTSEARRSATTANVQAALPAGALAAPALSEASDAAGRPLLSGLAQLISRIAASASQAAPLPATVLPSLHTQADALPEAIRSAVQASGLFYESHLEDWVSGRRTLEQLRMEPQGAIPVRAAPGATGQAQPLALEARHAMDASARQATPPALPPEAETLASRPAQAAWTPPVVLEPVIREQLAALAQGSASVPIVPWPGQQALLTVHEEPRQEPRERGNEVEEQAAGRLGLKLTLPRLGAVTFLVSAEAEHIRVDARAAEPTSRDALAARSADLQQALAGRALSLEALHVDAGAT